MSDQNIKELISRSIDEKLSPAEMALVESSLIDSAELRAYRAELLRLKVAMDQWPGIGTSPDWEHKMDKIMVRHGIKEAIGMKFPKSKLQAVALVILVIMVFSTVQIYIKRGIQGRMRAAADDIGDQYSAGNTNVMKIVSMRTGQYEPYYSESSYSVRDKSVGQTADLANGKANTAPEVIQRRIIRNSNLSLEVTDCAETQTKIAALVSKFDGMIENSQLTRSGGINASGSTVFKVSPKNLAAILIEIKGLGTLQSETLKSDDVTGQYVDIEARLGNWRMVRDRLSKLLDEKPSKVEDVLNIERELARVTGEIESAEGQLKYLSQVTDMATVTVNYYVKPGATIFHWNFDFKNKFRDALQTAIDAAIMTFNAVIVVIGFLLPVAFWSLLIWGIVLVYRKITKK